MQFQFNFTALIVFEGHIFLFINTFRLLKKSSFGMCFKIQLNLYTALCLSNVDFKS